MSQFIRRNFPFCIQAKLWLFKMTILLVFFMTVLWYFVGLLGVIYDSDSLYAMERDVAGHFCVDRNGYAITRKEVQLIKQKELKKNYFMTIAIPTIERIKNGRRFSYLIMTMNDLIKKIPNRVRSRILIIILCADKDKESRRRIAEAINRHFHEFIESGMVRVIRVPDRFYYDLENLPRTFNDSETRVKWRSKQALDYAFLFYFSYGLAKYHLQLEDDIEFDDGFFEYIEEDISNLGSQWIVLHYFEMGFIGKLIKSEYLRMFADILRMYYFEVPLDLLYIRPFRFAGLDDKFMIGSRFVFHHKGEFSSSKNAEP